MSQGVNQPGIGVNQPKGKKARQAKKLGGKQARGWISQGVKEPEGEKAMGQNGKVAKKPDTQCTSAVTSVAVVKCRTASTFLKYMLTSECWRLWHWYSVYFLVFSSGYLQMLMTLIRKEQFEDDLICDACYPLSFFHSQHCSLCR